jgi:hypothetical protein
MLLGSEHHVRTCDVCAEVCETCAKDCESLGDDDMLQRSPRHVDGVPSPVGKWLPRGRAADCEARIRPERSG